MELNDIVDEATARYIVRECLESEDLSKHMGFVSKTCYDPFYTFIMPPIRA